MFLEGWPGFLLDPLIKVGFALSPVVPIPSSPRIKDREVVPGGKGVDVIPPQELAFAGLQESEIHVVLVVLEQVVPEHLYGVLLVPGGQVADVGTAVGTAVGTLVGAVVGVGVGVLIQVLEVVLQLNPVQHLVPVAPVQAAPSCIHAGALQHLALVFVQV